MRFENDKEVVDYVKVHLTPEKWVMDARDNKKVLKALIEGEKFTEVLIDRIEKIESKDRQEVRKKHSKDIRDLFYRVMQPRESVHNAHGGSIVNKLSDTLTKRINEVLNEFKGQKSIDKYYSENFFRLADTDPNGLNFIEFIGEEDIYPTYKSIDDIRHYVSNGQLLEVLLFEPVDIFENDKYFQRFRLVSENKDYSVDYKDGNYVVNPDVKLTFEHPFNGVPATILSCTEETGRELRRSDMFPIIELSKDYARDKSVNTAFKFLHGFPLAWGYERDCRGCRGSGKDRKDQSKSCDSCNGTGLHRRSDVTDRLTLDMPTGLDGKSPLTKLAGWEVPPLDTWVQYNVDMKDIEERIEKTIWGTQKVKESNNETATGRFIDVQPIIARNEKYTDNIEWTKNQTIHFIEDWMNKAPVEEYKYTKIEGRNYIMESPDTILEKYISAKKEGANSVVLDKLLDEYILSKYHTNSELLERAQVKRRLEPHIHLSVEQVNSMFGRAEAAKKVLFSEFWNDPEENIEKDESKIKEAFKKYVSENNIEIEEQQTQQKQIV
jgi:hypothetical protein